MTIKTITKVSIFILIASKTPQTAEATLASLVASEAVAASERYGNDSYTLVDQNSHRSFADNITAFLHKNDNDITSALGVSMAFSLIYPGCTGEAVDQISDVLGFPWHNGTGSSDTEIKLVWETTTNRLLDKYNGECLFADYDNTCYEQAPLLEVANSLWYDYGESLNVAYEVAVGEYARQIDFSAAESPIIINDWVENQTNGLIDSIIPEEKPLNSQWDLIAINSIYLKATWSHKFEEENTNIDSFFSSTSRKVEVSTAHFMHGVFDDLRYSHEAIPNYQILELPFKASDMSMIVVLPMKEDMEGVSSVDLLVAIDDLESTRIALAFPKFRIESIYDDDLMTAVFHSGITAPFTGGSLCGIFEEDSCKLFIQDIIQKTFINVNENGIEAAAVTAIMLGRGLPNEEPVLMMCDHPFQFFIHDKTEDLVLFEGRVGAPNKTDHNSTETSLLGKHSDEGFWRDSFFVDPVDPAFYELDQDEIIVGPYKGIGMTISHAEKESSHMINTEVGNLSGPEILDSSSTRDFVSFITYSAIFVATLLSGI